MKRYLSTIVMVLGYMGFMILLIGIFSYIIHAVCLYFPSVMRSSLGLSILERSVMLLSTGIPAFVLMKYWEHTPLSDLGLSLRGRGKDMLWGTLTAMAIYTIGFGVSLLLGVVEITGMHIDVTSLMLSWLLMLLVAVTEEVALRGFVLGRLLNAGINCYWALFISSLLFSLMHLGNPDFSLLAFFNILLAGYLLGAAYIYTRNLWFAIALHLFWNWIQGPVLGYGVSGGKLEATLLSLRFSGKDFLSGGAFGFEGSIICTVLMIVFTILILKVASKRCACAPSQCSALAPARVDE